MSQLYLLLLAIFSTSLLSGIIGMGGGAILMGVIVWALPVSVAMILHGVVQLCANGFRAFLFRHAIYWLGIKRYLLGLGVALLLFSSITFIPDAPLVLILLGALPFLSLLIPKSLALDFVKPRHQVACGFWVTTAQLLCGVSGPLLDIYFIKGQLKKEAVMATKSFTQSIGHLAKLGYYLTLIIWLEEEAAQTELKQLPAWLWWAAIVLAFMGTGLGKKINQRLKEGVFRRLSAAIMMAIGCVFIYRGVALW